MKNKTGVYKIVNKINGKVYYGSAAVSLISRWYDHRKRLRKGTHENGHLQAAWDKYKEINFEFNIILECLPQECLMYEQMCLDLYWDGGQQCYNIVQIAGSNLGRVFSVAARRNMSIAHKGQISWLKGTKGLVKHSAVTLEKLRRANMYNHPSEEATGVKLNWEIVGEIRDQHKTGNYTLAELSRQYNVSSSAIFKVVKHKSWKLIRASISRLIPDNMK